MIERKRKVSNRPLRAALDGACKRRESDRKSQVNVAEKVAKIQSC